MVKAWHQAEGTTLIREQIKALNAASWIANAFTEEQDEQFGLGFTFNGEWQALETMSTSVCYKKIMIVKQGNDRRYQFTKREKETMTVNKTMTVLKTNFSPKERDYWWRVAHNRISIMRTESKWRRDESG